MSTNEGEVHPEPMEVVEESAPKEPPSQFDETRLLQLLMEHTSESLPTPAHDPQEGTSESYQVPPISHPESSGGSQVQPPNQQVGTSESYQMPSQNQHAESSGSSQNPGSSQRQPPNPPASMFDIPQNPVDEFLATDEEIDEEFDKFEDDNEEDMTILEPGADETEIDPKKFKVVNYDGVKYRQKIKPIWNGLLGKLKGYPYLVPRPLFDYMMRRVPRTKKTYREAVRARYQDDDYILLDLVYTEGNVEKKLNFFCDSRRLIKDLQDHLESRLQPEKTFRKIHLLFGTTKYKLAEKQNYQLRHLVKMNQPRFMIKMVFKPMTAEEMEEQKKKNMERRIPVIDITEECERFEEERRREMRGLRKDTRKEQHAQRARRQRRLMAQRAQRDPDIEWLDAPARPAPPTEPAAQAVPRRRSSSVEEFQILDPVLPGRASATRDPEPLEAVPARTEQPTTSRAPEPRAPDFDKVEFVDPAPEQIPAPPSTTAPDRTASVLQQAAAILEATVPETPEPQLPAPEGNALAQTLAQPKNSIPEAPVTPVPRRRASKSRVSSTFRDFPAPEDEAPVQPKRALIRRNSAQGEEVAAEQVAPVQRRRSSGRNSRDPTPEQPVSRRTRRASREQSPGEVAPVELRRSSRRNSRDQTPDQPVARRTRRASREQSPEVQLRRSSRRRNSAQREPTPERATRRKSSRLGSRAKSRSSVRAESPEQELPACGRRRSTSRTGASEEPQRKRGRPRSRGSEESPERRVPAPVRNAVGPLEDESELHTPGRDINPGSENEEDEEDQMPALAMAIDDDLGAGNEEEPPQLPSQLGDVENPEEEEEEEAPQLAAQLTPPPPVVHYQAPTPAQPPKLHPAVPQNIPRHVPPTVPSQSSSIKRAQPRVVPLGEIIQHPLPENGVIGIEDIRRHQKAVIEEICVFFQFDFVLDVQDPAYDEILNNCYKRYQRTAKEQKDLTVQLNICQDSLEDAEEASDGDYNEKTVKRLEESVKQCKINLENSLKSGQHYCEMESNKAKYNIKQRNKEEQKQRQMEAVANELMKRNPMPHGQMTPQGNNNVLYGKISPNGQIILPGQTPQQQRVLIPQGSQIVVQQPLIIPPQVIPKKRKAPGQGPGPQQMGPNGQIPPQQIIMTPQGPMVQQIRFIVPNGQAAPQLQMNPQGMITVPQQAEGPQPKRIPHILQKPRANPVPLQFQGSFVPGHPQQNGQTPRFITSGTPLKDNEVIARLLPVGKSPQNSGSPPQSAPQMSNVIGTPNVHPAPNLPNVAARTLAAQLAVRSAMGSDKPPFPHRIPPSGGPPLPAHQTVENSRHTPLSAPQSLQMRTPEVGPTQAPNNATPLPAHQINIDQLVQAGIDFRNRATRPRGPQGPYAVVTHDRNPRPNNPIQERTDMQISGTPTNPAASSRGPGHHSIQDRHALAQHAKRIVASVPSPSAPPVFRRPPSGGPPQIIEDRTGIRTSITPVLPVSQAALALPLSGHQSIQSSVSPVQRRAPSGGTPSSAHQISGDSTSETPTIPSASVNVTPLPPQQLVQDRADIRTSRTPTQQASIPPMRRRAKSGGPVPPPAHQTIEDRTGIRTSRTPTIPSAPAQQIAQRRTSKTPTPQAHPPTQGLKQTPPGIHTWTPPVPEHNPPPSGDRRPPQQNQQVQRFAPRLPVICPFVMQHGSEKFQFLTWRNPAFTDEKIKWPFDPVKKTSPADFGRRATIQAVHEYRRAAEIIRVPKQMFLQFYHRGDNTLTPKNTIVPVGMYNMLMSRRICDLAKVCIPKLPDANYAALYDLDFRPGDTSYNKSLLFDKYMGWSDYPGPPMPAPQQPIQVPQQGAPPPPSSDGPTPAKKRKAYKPSKCVEEPQPSTSDTQIDHSPTSSEASAEL